TRPEAGRDLAGGRASRRPGVIDRDLPTLKKTHARDTCDSLNPVAQTGRSLTLTIPSGRYSGSRAEWLRPTGARIRPPRLRPAPWPAPRHTNRRGLDRFAPACLHPWPKRGAGNRSTGWPAK